MAVLATILMVGGPALLTQERVGASEVLDKPEATAYMSGIHATTDENPAHTVFALPRPYRRLCRITGHRLRQGGVDYGNG